MPLSHVSPSSSRPAKRQIPGRNQSDDEGIELSEDDNYISVEDALKVVRDESQQTRAPTETENAVWNRVLRYEHLQIALHDVERPSDTPLLQNSTLMLQKFGYQLTLRKFSRLIQHLFKNQLKRSTPETQSNFA